MRPVDGITRAAADAVELVLWRHGVYRGNWIEPNFPWRHKLKLDVREEPDDTFVTVTWQRPFPSGETVTVASRNVWIEHDRRPRHAPPGLRLEQPGKPRVPPRASPASTSGSTPRTADRDLRPVRTGWPLPPQGSRAACPGGGRRTGRFRFGVPMSLRCRGPRRPVSGLRPVRMSFGDGVAFASDSGSSLACLGERMAQGSLTP